MRVWKGVATLLVALIVSGCGGGGGGSNNSNSGINSAPLVTPAASSLSGNNVLPLIVDAGPLPATAPAANTPFVSVTICEPGSTTNCQTIDHIIVDTGSSGLRLISSVLNPSLNLPQQTLSGVPLNECLQFADSYSWGSVKTADVQLGGETTISSLAIQVIGDPNFPNVPSSCSSNAGPSENTVQTFGGNGIIGVSVFQQDCGSACASSPAPAGTYYTCTSSSAYSCSSAAVPLGNQIQNPVGLLTTDNNGVVIDLPPVPATGATTASGYLILGIGTQSNNTLGSATIYTLDPTYGTLTTVYKDQTGVITTYSAGINGGFLDSGSNGLFFSDNGITQCGGGNSGFYCPTSILSLSATNQGTTGSAITASFSVGNANNLFNTYYGNTPYAAFSNLAGTAAQSGGFDWGLPFFFGRTVFTAIEGTSSGGATGPYVAY